MKMGEFISHARDYLGTNKHKSLRKFIKPLSQYIIEDEVKVFYPKNVFTKEEELEIYVFRNQSVICFEDHNNRVMIKHRRYEDISKVDLLQEDDEDPELILTITFNTGEIIILTSVDTNSSWQRKFEEKIIEVFKMLTK